MAIGSRAVVIGAATAFPNRDDNNLDDGSAREFDA